MLKRILLIIGVIIFFSDKASAGINILSNIDEKEKKAPTPAQRPVSASSAYDI